MAAVDVNGDGQDEVLVGAPLFFNEAGGHHDQQSGSSQGVYFEEGRVSIFTYSDGAFEERISIFGMENAGRFGAAIAGLGDLDGDGFGDFAVGAPFSASGVGIVAIYFGKSDVESIQGKNRRTLREKLAAS